MQHNENGFVTTLLVLIIALIIIGGGVYMYKPKAPILTIDTSTQTTIQNEQTSTQQDSTPNKTIDTKTTPKPASVTPTAWKTYDSGRGFSFKYPSHFIFDTNNSTPERIIFNYSEQDQKQLIVTVETSNTSLEEIVKNTLANEKSNSTQFAISSTPYTVKNLNGYLIISQNRDMQKDSYFTFKTKIDTTLFSFNYTYNPSSASQSNFYAEIQAIISTLK